MPVTLLALAGGGPTVDVLIAGRRVFTDLPLRCADDLLCVSAGPSGTSSGSGSGSISGYRAAHPDAMDDGRPALACALGTLGGAGTHFLLRWAATASAAAGAEADEQYVMTAPTSLFSAAGGGAGAGAGAGGEGAYEELNGAAAWVVCSLLAAAPASGPGAAAAVAADALALMMTAQRDLGPQAVVSTLLHACLGHVTDTTTYRGRSLPPALAARCRGLAASGAARLGPGAEPFRVALFDAFHALLEDRLLGAPAGAPAGVATRAIAAALLSAAHATQHVATAHTRRTDAGQAAATYAAYYTAVLSSLGAVGAAGWAGWVMGPVATAGPPHSVEDMIIGDEGPAVDPLAFTAQAGTVPSALRWVVACVEAVGAADASGPGLAALPTFPAPLLDGGVDMFPSLGVVRHFFTALLASASPPAGAEAGAEARAEAGAGAAWEVAPWAVRIADAFVLSAQSAGAAASLSLLPAALRALVELALFQCRHTPPAQWPQDVLAKIGRPDICANVHGSAGRARALALRAAAAGGTTSTATTGPPPAATTATAVGPGAGTTGGATKASGASTSDGLMEVEHEASRLRFAEDDRVHEVCRMLRSSAHIYLRLDKVRTHVCASARI